MMPDRDIRIDAPKASLRVPARGQARDRAASGEDDVIPGADVLDTAGLRGLVAKCDDRCFLLLSPEQVTVDDPGSLEAMADCAVGLLPAGTP